MRVLMIEVLIVALFASSLHFLMGPSGMIRSATPRTSASAPMARRCARRSGCRWRRRSLLGPVLAAGRAGLRLVLRAALGRLPRDADVAFAQIAWSVVFQWYA